MLCKLTRVAQGESGFMRSILLVDVGHGFDTLPLWLGRLWAVAFYDFAGVLAGEEAKLRDRQTSAGFAGAAGVELRLGLEIGYLPFGTLRLGGALVHGDAEDRGALGVAGWLRLGN